MGWKETNMGISTVNISFKDELLKEIDQLARQESRSRSELIREAARLYIERRNKWQQIFAFGRKLAVNLNLKEEDIDTAVRNFRNSRKSL